MNMHVALLYKSYVVLANQIKRSCGIKLVSSPEGPNETKHAKSLIVKNRRNARRSNTGTLNNLRLAGTWPTLISQERKVCVLHCYYSCVYLFIGLY